MITIILIVNDRPRRILRWAIREQDKAASHDRIVRIAAGRVREAGADALGVAELMQEAGADPWRLLPPFLLARRAGGRGAG